MISAARRWLVRWICKSALQWRLWRWALTKNAYIPSGPIKSHNEYYELNESREYYFDRNSEYLFSEVKHVPGIRNGNGQLIITVVQYIHWNSCVTKYYLLNYFMSFALFIS